MQSNLNKRFCYIELATLTAAGKMLRHKFVNKNDVQKIEDWAHNHSFRDLFTSAEQYEKPDSDCESICPIIFDVDCPNDLVAAKESTLKLCELLFEKLGLTSDHLVIHFSGSKGFHLNVPCEVFCPDPNKWTIKLYKRMSEKAAGWGIDHIDSGIYSKRRLWRLPNSINTKSGLYKIPLSHKELMNISMPRILELAQNPRPDQSMIPSKPCQTAIQWYKKSISIIAQSKTQKPEHKTDYNNFKNGWRMIPCIKNIHTATVPDGMRHQIYRQFARYCAYLKMHPEEIHERIAAVDKRNPIRDTDYISRIIDSACDNPGFAGCQSVLKHFCNKDICFYARLKGKNNN